MNQFIRSALKSAGITYFFYILNFIAQLILARLLTPEMFGTIALILSLLAILDMLTTFSIPMAYIQAEETTTLFSSALFLSYILILFKLLVGTILLSFFSFMYDENILFLLFILIVAKIPVPISSLYISKLEKEINFEYGSLLVGASTIIASIFALLGAYLGFEIYSLMIREIIPSLILFFSIILIYGIDFKVVYVKNEVMALFHYSSKMLFSRGAEIAFFKVPFIVIDNLFGPVVLGLLSQMMYISNLLNRVLGLFTQKIAFVFFSIYKNNEQINKRGTNYLNIVVLFVTVPIGIYIYFFPLEIILFLWGDKWTEGEQFLKYLSIYIIVLPLFNALKSKTYAHARNNIVSITYVFSMIFLILFSYLIYLLDYSAHTLSILFSSTILLCFILLKGANAKNI